MCGAEAAAADEVETDSWLARVHPIFNELLNRSRDGSGWLAELCVFTGESRQGGHRGHRQVARAGAYFFGFLTTSPYNSSSVNSTHLNSRSSALLSTRR